MAGITGIAGVNVVGTLARGNRPVVATDTGTHHLRMIHTGRRNRHPCGREFLVAGFTQVTGIDVRRTFTTGSDTVMTAGAITGKRRVIHAGRQPGGYAMTDIALFNCRNVSCALACCNNIVMTATAIADDFVMVDGCWDHR